MTKKTKTKTKPKPVVTITRPNGHEVEMTNEELGDLVWNLLDHFILQGRKLSEKVVEGGFTEKMKKDIGKNFIFVLGFANGEAEAKKDKWANRNFAKVKW